MSDLILAVITKLLANASVVALVGTKIYRRGSVPTRPVIPYVIVYQVDGTRDNDTSTGRYAHSRIQCSAFAAADLAAANISETIADCLHRTQNAALVAGASNVYVVSVKDAGIATDENPDIPLYTHHRDFKIHYDYR